MSRSPLPIVIDDISVFATVLRRNWPTDPPGQAQTLALIAQAAGYRNHQHLKAEGETSATDSAEEQRVKEALRVFDAQGIMTRWPQKTSVQRLCLLWFWSRLPGRIDLNEPEVNEILQAGENFGDHVLLRRSLIDHGYVTRSADGRVYRRIEAKPSPAARVLLRALSERHLAAKT